MFTFLLNRVIVNSSSNQAKQKATCKSRLWRANIDIQVIYRLFYYALILLH